MTAPEPSQGSIFTESSRIRIATGNLVPTTSFREAVTFLDRVVADGEGLYLLTGAPGAGKTALLNYCRDRAADRAEMLLAPLRRIDADNLSALLNEAFGVENSAKQGSRTQDLRYFLKLGTLRAKGKRFVLALDEVEEIHSSGAELIRALLEMKAQKTALITIILSGNHQLNALLDRTYRWGIQKLIQDSHQIATLNLDQASDLIDQIPALRSTSPIGFKRGAKKSLVNLTGGITGPIIQLGHRAATIGRRYGAKAVSARMVRGAVSGNYRPPSSVVTGVTWKVSLALLVLLLVPVALVQQNLDTNDYASRPVGGFLDTQQTPVTALQIAPLVVSQSVARPQPNPTEIEDDIPNLARSGNTVTARRAPSVSEPTAASLNGSPDTSQGAVFTPATAGLRPDFNLDIPPAAGTRYLGFTTEIPSRVSIYQPL